MKNRRLFISIFAISLAVTLLVSPVKVFNNPVIETIQVRAEEEPITDTQRGIALLMTIMLAQGLRFVGDWNNVVQPGLEQLWNDFSTATGNAVTLPMIVAGSSLALGYIRTSNTVNNAINAFQNWLVNDYDVPTTGEISIPMGVGSFYNVPANTCTYEFTQRSNGQDYKVKTSVDTRGGFFSSDGRVYYFFVAPGSSFQISPDITGSACPSGFTSNVFSNTVVNGVTYYVWQNNISASFFSNTAIEIINASPTLNNMVAYTYGDSATLGDTSLVGQSLELKDGYQLESDQAKLYDIAGLEALVASLALTLENIDDLVRDIPLIFDTPWAEDFPDVPAYVDTPDDTIPWVDVPDSVIPADTPEYVPTIPSERDEYKVLGLEQVFPFSIPFDLYYLSQILVSEPQTPEFQYAAVNPINGNLLTIDVDLHDFDGVASIFRTCEIVLFIAFLIWVTRSLIRS